MPQQNSHDRPIHAPAVETRLGMLRVCIRLYVCLEGCAAAVAWLGAAFWLTLAADWFFEPPPAVRAVVLAAVAAILAIVVVRLIVRRIFVPITDANAAMVLERRFPHLNDSLLTSVVLGDRFRSASVSPAFVEAGGTPALRSGGDLGGGTAVLQDDLNHEMLAQTYREAAERIGQVGLWRVFNPRPLYLHGSAAALLSISVALFAILFFSEFGVWARRTLAMSDVAWPRNTRLEVMGFENNSRKVARGSDFEVVVRADATMPRVPETVEIRYRTEGGGRGRATMDRRGAARGPEDGYQEYTYTFRGVLADVCFDVLGGDDRKVGYRIEAVDSPTISQMEVACELPSYIGRKQPRQPVTGVMQIPMGSRVTVLAGQANKDIVGVRVNSIVGDRVGPAMLLDTQELAADRRGFSCRLDPLTTDTTLLFTLTDSDGIESRDPLRLTLVAAPDQPPQLAVQLEGIGTAITPTARVAVSGQISDDYGIGRIWFERAIDQQQRHAHPLADLRHPPAVYNLSGAGLDVRELGLKPGQKLLVSVKAADLCDLGHGPNTASTETWLLDVVTPDQLRAILAARELVLRQRFEQMIREMSDTRDLLARMEFVERGRGTGDGGWGAESSNLKSSNLKSSNLKSANLKSANLKSANLKSANLKSANHSGPQANSVAKGDGKRSGVEPGDEDLADSPARRREMRFLRVQGALTNCHKGAPEVKGVAESFDDIYKQFVNNRIDTAELKDRLKGNIAEPLHRIVETMFPDLNRGIEELQTALDDRDRAPALRDGAQQQAQAILLAMQKVRDHMIELEDFNEAVELLRNIVDMQKKLHEETQERHNEKIRDLLKE
jgi:hypothetical protein